MLPLRSRPLIQLAVDGKLCALIIIDKMLSGTRKERILISADLGKQLEGFVAKLVASGRYNSKSEVLREGVRLIEEREAKLAALDLAIARGLADAEAGRTRPALEVLDRLKLKYGAMARPSE